LTGAPAHPVKFFSVFGMLVAAVYAEVLFRWMTGPYFKPSPVGTDPIPPWELSLIRFSEVFCAALIVLFVWTLLVKPWIRDKRISWDGMLMLCLFSMWVLDPICNYFNFTFMYNAYWINRGSWCLYLPGWQSPRGSNLPEPFFLMGGIYLWWTTINVLAFSWTLRKLRVSMPAYSMLVHVPIAYAVICALDMILELPGRSGLGDAVGGYSASVSAVRDFLHEFQLHLDRPAALLPRRPGRVVGRAGREPVESVGQSENHAAILCVARLLQPVVLHRLLHAVQLDGDAGGHLPEISILHAL
jgi:hypothetical protein